MSDETDRLIFKYLFFGDDEDEEEEELSRKNIMHLATQLNVSIEDAVWEFKRVGIRVENRFHESSSSGFRGSDNASSISSKVSEDSLGGTSSLRLPKL